jgi:hypothetical protein
MRDARIKALEEELTKRMQAKKDSAALLKEEQT